MYCPNCGTKCADSYHFCYHCGFQLPELTLPPEPIETNFIEPQTPVADPIETDLIDQDSPVSEAEMPRSVEQEPTESTPGPEEVAATEPTLSAPTPKKGRLWPPLAAMGLLITLGICLFFFGPKAPPQSSDFLTIAEGAVTFHAEYYTGGPELTIPSEIDGQTVTAIAPGGFRDCELESVILPETITEIGAEAFANCDALRGIYIPGSVIQIGNAAFSDSDGLEAIYLPGSLESIGEDALGTCDRLKYIIFSGTYDQWAELYDGKFVSRVELHALDGTYYTHP